MYRFVLLTILLSTFGLQAQTWEFSNKSAIENPESNTGIIGAVATTGFFTVVAYEKERRDENNENPIYNAGAVYVFHKDQNGAWEQFQKIVAPDRFEADGFGNALDIDGTTIVVGAEMEDHMPDGSRTQNFAGSVYIFDRNENDKWELTQKIVPSDRQVGDNFGSSVAIKGDYIIVGARNEDPMGQINEVSGAGSAYIFKRDGSGKWNEVQKLVASDFDRGDRFGISVDIAHGGYCVVGATGCDFVGLVEQAGAAYVFKENSSGVWVEEQKLHANDKNGDDVFGTTVAIENGYVLASSPETNSTNSIAYRGSGAVYVFKRNPNGTWGQNQKLGPSFPKEFAGFGEALSLSNSYAVISSNSTNAVYIFKLNSNGTFEEIQILNNKNDIFAGFGRRVAISGNHIVVVYTREEVDGIADIGALCHYWTASPLVNIKEQELLTHKVKLLSDPTNGIHSIQFPVNISKVQLELYSMDGKLISSKEEYNTSIISQLISTKGMFLLKFTTKEGIAGNFKVFNP